MEPKVIGSFSGKAFVLSSFSLFFILLFYLKHIFSQIYRAIFYDCCQRITVASIITEK